MALSHVTNFLESPFFLRLLGIGLAGVGLFGLAKGLFSDLEQGEYWWGYVGVGIVSIVFSVGVFIWASAEAEMRADSNETNEEDRQPSRVKEGTSGHTSH